jgi:cytochrome c6
VELTVSDSSGPVRRRRASALELGLLAVALVALGFGAGALGWTIGHGSTATRVVTVAARAPAGRGAAVAAVKGDPAAGKGVFVRSGCGSCHTLAAARANGTVGPNLDQVKLTPSEIRAWVGVGKGAMPSFKHQLTQRQIADVAAFLANAER